MIMNYSVLNLPLIINLAHSNLIIIAIWILKNQAKLRVKALTKSSSWTLIQIALLPGALLGTLCVIQLQ